jgi:hypothetical protein
MMPTRLPPRRPRVPFRIERGVKREWPRHRRFVRSFGCSVPLCTTNTPIEFAHLRSAATAGTGVKPHDGFGVSLCGAEPARGIEGHHAEYHRLGHDGFERKYRVDLRAVAAAFVRASPDREMRASLKLVEAAALDPLEDGDPR